MLAVAREWFATASKAELAQLPASWTRKTAATRSEFWCNVITARKTICALPEFLWAEKFPLRFPTPKFLCPQEFRQCANCLRSEEHTSELQSRQYLVCRLLLEKKKTKS